MLFEKVGCGYWISGMALNRRAAIGTLCRSNLLSLPGLQITTFCCSPFGICRQKNLFQLVFDVVTDASWFHCGTNLGNVWEKMMVLGWNEYASCMMKVHPAPTSSFTRLPCSFKLIIRPHLTLSEHLILPWMALKAWNSTSHKDT